VACETICTFFNVFYVFFFKIQKNTTCYVFGVVAHVFPNSGGVCRGSDTPTIYVEGILISDGLESKKTLRRPGLRHGPR